MAHIAAHDQGFIEKHTFGFFRGDLMPLPVFVRVAFIPFKPGTSIQRVSAFRHDFSIYLIYTPRNRVRYTSGNTTASSSSSVHVASVTPRCAVQRSVCETLSPGESVLKGPSVSSSRMSALVKVSKVQPKSG